MNLEQLAQYHNEWVKIVKTFGAKSEAEDIVQEMYLRFHKYSKGQKINKAFIWVMLRNSYYDYYKKQIFTIDIDNVHDIAEEGNKNNDDELYYQTIDNEVNKWEWFDKQLFLLYLRSGKSMREIQKETGISLKIIFYTIKKCKLKLNGKVERIRRHSSEVY